MSEQNGGLGVIWQCDNCQRVTETGLDDLPEGWLVEEFDEDDYGEHEDIPDDLILCAGCYVPANIFRANRAESETEGDAHVQ